MRAGLAAATDAALVAILGFIAFRLGVTTAPCGRHMDSCAPLNPLVILFVLLALVLYFGLGYWLWRSTPGRHIFGVEPDLGSNREDLNDR